MRLESKVRCEGGTELTSPLAGEPMTLLAQRRARAGEFCTCGRSAVVVFLIEGQAPVGWCGLSDGGRPGPCAFCGDPAGHWEGPRCPAYRLRPPSPPPSADDPVASPRGVNGAGQ